MAAKEVFSVLSVLTSDGLECCKDWSDNYTTKALIAEYFTGSGNDEEFEESSVCNNNGTLMNILAMYKYAL